MANTAHKLMTVDEFLAWKGEGDTRYQLRDGVPVAMAPAADAHGLLTANLVIEIGTVLKHRRPCAVRTEAGLPSPSNSRSFHEVDVAVSCTPSAADRQHVEDPIILIEVLSPSTADDDRRIKLPDYRMIASVQEIVLIDSLHMYCEVHRRQDGNRWLTDILREPSARLRLDSIGFDADLETLYAAVPLAS